MPNRSAQLKAIREEIEDLTLSPLYEYRHKNGYHPVIGAGSPRAQLMLIGEAPGKQEALQGKPFVGAAGRILDELLKSIALEREQIYITNIVKDRPPENRPPQKDELKLYAPFLLRQIEIIQPAVIATLGRYSLEFILEEFHMPERGHSITELHGRPLQANASYGPVTVVPLFHPAVAFYRRDQWQVMNSDFRMLGALLERPANKLPSQ